VAALLAGRAALLRAEGRWGPPGEASLTLALALGWGLLSHAALLLGAVHSATGLVLLRPGVAWFLVVLAALLGGRGAVRLLSGRVRQWAVAWRARPVATVVAVLILAAVLLPRLVVSWSPSFLYDVLEYHLPEARWAVATGGFAPMPGNAYSLMPQGAEALFAFGALLAGEGAPRIVHFYVVLTMLLAAAAVARELGVAPWLRVLAILMLLAHPIALRVQADAYVDMAPALYATAALLCWLRARRVPNRLDPILAGVFLGFVFSAKYPAVGVAVLPFLAILAPTFPRAALPGWIAKRPAWARGLLAVAMLGAITGLVYLPWLVRALLADHSPFPPLTVPWLGRAAVSAAGVGSAAVSAAGVGSAAVSAAGVGSAAVSANASAEELALRSFMVWAHRTEWPLAAAYVKALWGHRTDLGEWLALAVAILAVAPRVGTKFRAPALWVLAGYAVWNCTQDKIDRFLMPLLPAAAVLAVGVVSLLRPLAARLGSWLALPPESPLQGLLPRLWVLAALPLALWAGERAYFETLEIVRPWPGEETSVLHAAYLTGLGLQSREAFVERTLGTATGRLFNELNRSMAYTVVQRGAARALFVYEARVGAVTPPAQAVANTVFDPSPLWFLLRGERGGDPAWVLEQLRARGFTHLLVNETELARLLATYPAREIWGDAGRGIPTAPAYLAARKQLLPAHPMDGHWLAFRRYYPPHFYFAPGGDTAATEARLDRFLDYLHRERPPVWEPAVPGARMWFSVL
jgi:hypothetical protein